MSSNGRLTTHVLDVTTGRPAAGVAVTLAWLDGAEGDVPVTRAQTNADGRALLIAPGELVPGRYELTFAVGPYFAAAGVAVPDPPFLDEVVVRFGVADPATGYHVPLLVSPWSYSTYRGS